MSYTVHIVTVGNSNSAAKTLIATALKELKSQHNLIHIANIESITHVKTVLTSLVAPPVLLITASSLYDDEIEEVREITQRVTPETHLITIPAGLKTLAGDSKIVEYLVEQITESKLPTNS